MAVLSEILSKGCQNKYLYVLRYCPFVVVPSGNTMRGGKSEHKEKKIEISAENQSRDGLNSNNKRTFSRFLTFSDERGRALREFRPGAVALVLQSRRSENRIPCLWEMSYKWYFFGTLLDPKTNTRKHGECGFGARMITGFGGVRTLATKLGTSADIK